MIEQQSYLQLHLLFKKPLARDAFFPHGNSITICLLVMKTVALGLTTTVCVPSRIIAGPLSVSPACNLSNKKTGTSVLPPSSKYVDVTSVHLLSLSPVGTRSTGTNWREAISSNTLSPSELNDFPTPRTRTSSMVMGTVISNPNSCC